VQGRRSYEADGLAAERFDDGHWAMASLDKIDRNDSKLSRNVSCILT
jgi:hypothetical protein